MREMRWVPGIEVEEDEMYGGQMPKEAGITVVCGECGALNRHLRSCSQYTCDDQCEFCRAPAGLPHHPDCPDE